MSLLLMAILAAETSTLVVPSAQSRQEVIDLIAPKLRDPDGAKYRWPKTAKSDVGYCVFVNARNGYGGYNGYKLYFVLGAYHNGPKGDHQLHSDSIVAPDEEAGPMSEFIAKQCAAIGIYERELPPELPVQVEQKPATKKR